MTPALNLKASEVQAVAEMAREHGETEIAEKAEALALPKVAEPIPGQTSIYDALGEAA